MTARPILYSSKHYENLVQALLEDGVDMVHFTNGAFAARDLKIISEFPGTTAAGFQFIADHWIKERAPNVKHAFVIAIHGKDNMVKDYNADPANVDENEIRAERVIPAVRAHFAHQNIPVYGAAFDEISAVAIENYLHNAGFDLGAAFKFGDWGNAPGKFSVFEKRFRQVYLYPYAQQDKKPYMNNQGPWDGTGSDPRDRFRHQAGVAFYHAAEDRRDPQTKLLQVVDLFSANNQYLNADNTPTFKLAA